MYRLSLLVLLAIPSLSLAQPKTHQVKLNGHTFTLPEGFTIEVAVDAKLAPRPIACDFDEKGRLYVTDSSGSNENVKVQVEKKPHRILRLEDTDGDGKFDKQTVFVKHVMFPEGCMWLNGSLYVAAAPHIWKFTDTNDDGVADKEEIWFDGKTLTGCANDLHGPYRGPDGWIYWTKGAFAQQEYTVNGKPFRTRAAHIFRARPDGTGIEPVMTGGMDNPVDVVFTPGGDIIFSTTFFQHPANGKRDGLIHAVYGAVYGKDHSPVYDHPWTYPTLMPPMTHLGPAAPCGLHRYESDQFGKEYENNLFCCQFNMRKVSRHVLVPKSSTYETKDSDFVVSDNIDFHPTDVIEDADGSLLVVDTGGWYKLCCPTSQLVKPDVTGAIYRVRKVGAHKVDDPRGGKIEWKKADIVELLRALIDDARPVVRERAADKLLTRGQDGIQWLARTAGTQENHAPHGLPALACAKLGCSSAPDVRKASRAFLNDKYDEAVVMIAIHAAGLWRDREAVSDLCFLLNSDRPHVRRAAATALGRIGDAKAVSWIISTLDVGLELKAIDRTCDHAMTYALIEIGDAKKVAEELGNKSPGVRRALLAALENIPNSGLEPKMVLKELDSPDAALRETEWWVAGRHPQWGDKLAGYFVQKLKTADKSKPQEREALSERLVKFAGNEAVQKVLAGAVGEPNSALTAMHVMARSGLKALPPVWRDALLTAAPKLADREAYRAALAVFRVLPANDKDFEKFVADAQRAVLWPAGIVPDEFKLATLASRPAGQPIGATATGYLVKKLDRGQPPPERAAAADALGRAKLSPEQLVSLAATLKHSNPLEISKLVAIFAKSKDEKVGFALVVALREPGLRTTIREEMVKPVLEKYPKTVQAEAEKLYAELAEARKDERVKLEKMLAELKPGDVRRGQLVFNNAKTQCIACHKVGYVGGQIGPDLTRIGGIRTERDLLEAIVFPSASFVRSYEPVRVLTTDERTFNGVLKKDAPDEIVIIVAADKEERVSRADVASITPSSVSLMPSGLDQQLSRQDLADLVAFLRACK